jgi:hypothetical protein
MRSEADTVIDPTCPSLLSRTTASNVVSLLLLPPRMLRLAGWRGEREVVVPSKPAIAAGVVVVHVLGVASLATVVGETASMPEVKGPSESWRLPVVHADTAPIDTGFGRMCFGALSLCDAS